MPAVSYLKPPGQRRAHDAYLTPRPLALAIVQHLQHLVLERNPSTIIEPSAGDGAFVAACKETWPRALITAVDVRPRCRAACIAAGAAHFQVGDWTHRRLDDNRVALIIGNPPYVRAQAHVEASLRRLAHRGYLAFLLRCGFLGSLARARTLWAQPGLRYQLPIAPRPSFWGSRTDGSEYSMFVWQQGYQGRAEILPPLIWRAR